MQFAWQKKFNLALWLMAALCILAGRAPAYASCHAIPPSAPAKSCCAAAGQSCHCPLASPTAPASPAHPGGMECSCLINPSPSESAPPSQGVRLVLPAVPAVCPFWRIAAPEHPVLRETALLAAPRGLAFAPSPPRAPPFQG
ncbi:MAG TPA: hypothetical protein VFB38_25835 [Chthonomonadaceae bacterium]|nr:hypothetical protein [Chthonomonadaceae bacterium]